MSCSHWTSTDTFSASVNSILPASAVSLVDSVVDFAVSLLRAALGYDGTLRRIPRMSTGTSFQSRPMGDLEEVLRGFFSLPGRGLPGESKRRGERTITLRNQRRCCSGGMWFWDFFSIWFRISIQPRTPCPCPILLSIFISLHRVKVKTLKGFFAIFHRNPDGLPTHLQARIKARMFNLFVLKSFEKVFTWRMLWTFFVCFFGEALGDLLGDAPLGDLDEALGDLGEMFLGELRGEAGEASLRDFLRWFRA